MDNLSRIIKAKEEEIAHLKEELKQEETKSRKKPIQIVTKSTSSGDFTWDCNASDNMIVSHAIAVVESAIDSLPKEDLSRTLLSWGVIDACKERLK